MTEVLYLDKHLSQLNNDCENFKYSFEISDDDSVVLYENTNRPVFNGSSIFMSVSLSSGVMTKNLVKNPVSAFKFGQVFGKDTLNVKDLRNKLDAILDFLSPIIKEKGFIIEFDKFFTSDMKKSTAHYIAEEYEIKDFDDSLIELLGKIYLACYPVFGQIIHNKMNRSDSSFVNDGFYSFENDGLNFHQPFHNSPNMRDFIEKVYGVYRKNFVKTVHCLDSSFFYFTNKVYSFVSPDFMEKLAKNYANELLKNRNVSNLGHILFQHIDFDNLMKFSVTVRQRLIEDIVFDTTDNLHRDFIIDSLEEIVNITDRGRKQLKGSKTWEDVHDVIFNNFQEEKYSQIAEIPDDFKKLFDNEICEMTFKPLTNIQEFVNVGKNLNICLKSAIYLKKSLRNESYCFSIFSQNELIGAVELGKDFYGHWDIIQLRKSNNKLFDNEKEIKQRIYELLDNPNKNKRKANAYYVGA